jgi:phosphate transport system ATP-binding protein
MTNGKPHIEFRDVCAFYGSKQVLRNVSFSVPRHSVIGVIGPANSGKTTMLGPSTERSISSRAPGSPASARQWESVAGLRNPNELRRRIGMVFPLPVGLP